MVTRKTYVPFWRIGWWRTTNPPSKHPGRLVIMLPGILVWT